MVKNAGVEIVGLYKDIPVMESVHHIILEEGLLVSAVEPLNYYSKTDHF